MNAIRATIEANFSVDFGETDVGDDWGFYLVGVQTDVHYFLNSEMFKKNNLKKIKDLYPDSPISLMTPNKGEFWDGELSWHYKKETNKSYTINVAHDFAFEFDATEREEELEEIELEDVDIDNLIVVIKKNGDAPAVFPKKINLNYGHIKNLSFDADFETL